MLADPRTRPLRAFLLAAGLLAFSGCTSPSGENQDGVFHAEASDPMIMAPPGTPYDGSGMIGAQGSMLVHTIDETNAGYVNVDLSTGQGMRFSIHWAAFSIQPGQAWQDGGIATNVVEHGSSGQGNKMEPQFNLFSGGWGRGNATMNGGPVVDPVTGSEILNLHYMVTKEAMLEEGSMKVYKSDRRTLFDPKDPGDGYVFPNRPEGHFAIWGSGAYKDGLALPKPPPVVTNHTDTATGVSYTKSYPIPISAVMSQIEVDAHLNAGGVGQLTLNLKDPSGKTVATGTMTPQQGARLNTSSGPLALGNYSLEVTGQGVNAGYVAQVTMTPPTPFLLHVVFTQVKFGN